VCLRKKKKSRKRKNNQEDKSGWKGESRPKLEGADVMAIGWEKKKKEARGSSGGDQAWTTSLKTDMWDRSEHREPRTVAKRG